MIAKIILIGLQIMALGLYLGKHGEDKGKYNFWVGLLTVAINFTLFYYAGVFNF